MPRVPALSNVLRPLLSTSHSATTVTGIGTSQTTRFAALEVACDSPAFMNMGMEKY